MEHNNLTYDAAANLMLAFRVMQDLKATAKACALRPTTMLTDDNDGDFYFYVHDIGAELGRCFLKDITTEEASIFAQKAEVFRTYWTELMHNAKDTNAAKIAALKAELAKLEGRA